MKIKRYFNHKSKPRPKFVEMEVSPEFAENVVGMKVVATRRFCSKSLCTYKLR